MKISPLFLLLPLVARTLCAQSLTPIADPGTVMPPHGTVSIAPATRWEDALATGNGIMGAMLYGDPRKDTLLVNHCKLWLPTGVIEKVPPEASLLPQFRKIIGEKGYDAGQAFWLQKAHELGCWDGSSLNWTDAFHPAYYLNMEQPEPGAITDYARVVDFSAGEVWAQWHSPQGNYQRRCFVSKVDNTIVTTTTGPAGKVSLKLSMGKVDNPLIESHVKYEPGWITAHNIYVKGKGGYDLAIRIINDGGTMTNDADSISVTGANAVTIYARVLPWKIPFPASESWLTDPRNPEYSTTTGAGRPGRAGSRKTVQLAGPTYNASWARELRQDLQSLPNNSAALRERHRAAFSKIFDRVTIDLNGSPAERRLPTEVIAAQGQAQQRLTPAFLERMYDAGRYLYICSAGPETPPNLIGIWSGTWTPAWSGDYTFNTNTQLEVESAFSGNMAECMDGFFYFFNSLMPDFQHNAKVLFGARGMMSNVRVSDNGLNLHWGQIWQWNFWTVGPSWLAHYYYDYYLYTGDKQFLRTQAIPWMKQCALFWEDFLKGTEDASGHYLFRPSVSSENGPGDNSSQDIEITTELLTNLITACETLGVEKEGVVRWKALLAKLPPLIINDQGQIKEWSNPTSPEKNNHRHLMHLYGAFQTDQFTEEADPKLYAAAKVALMNRVNLNQEDATHGCMQQSMAAANLGLGDLAFARLEMMAKRRAIYPNMLSSHATNASIQLADGNGPIAEIVNRLFVQSRLGRLALLPAVPKTLPTGTLSGIRARGDITFTKLNWDMAAGKCEAVLVSGLDQSLNLVLARDMEVKSIKVDDAEQPISTKGVKKSGTTLKLHQGVPIHLAVTFVPAETSPANP